MSVLAAVFLAIDAMLIVASIGSLASNVYEQKYQEHFYTQSICLAVLVAIEIIIALHR